MKWEFYLPAPDVWVTCKVDRAIAWMLGGGLVRCSDG